MTIFLDVMTLSDEPSLVEKLGVTVNETKLSDVCIADNISA